MNMIRKGQVDGLDRNALLEYVLKSIKYFALSFSTNKIILNCGL